MLFAVADGVGGYGGAKEASSVAVEVLRDSASQISSEDELRRTLLKVHKEISGRSRRLGFRNMGTTVAAAKILPEQSSSLLANVGDSPILLYRNRRMVPVYDDDSHRGSDPLSMYGIIQYLGLEDIDIDVHTRTIHLIEGDVLLLCSDGITDNLLNSPTGNRLASLVEAGSAKKIVKSAINEGLKPDDMTAILVFL